MIKVKLITHTQNPQQIIAAAAKLCYSPADVESLMESLTPQKSADFVDMLTEIGHESPIEHVSFTFAVEGVSRAFLAQITRHRIASYSVQSQRYVGERSFEYVVPPEIQDDESAKLIFLEAMNSAQDYYNKLLDILTDKHTKALVQKGESEPSAKKKAAKMAMEDARFVLPNACDTKMMITMNARSLHNFFRHRCCNRAQWEIRQVAQEMLKLVLPIAPQLFAASGPPCISGGCPEGKMSCGEIEKVRSYYKSIQDAYI